MKVSGYFILGAIFFESPAMYNLFSLLFSTSFQRTSTSFIKRNLKFGRSMIKMNHLHVSISDLFVLLKLSQKQFCDLSVSTLSVIMLLMQLCSISTTL